MASSLPRGNGRVRDERQAAQRTGRFAPMSGRGRPLAARVLVLLACVVFVLALVAGYARLTVVDSDQFANRATSALRDDSVKSLIAERITDEVVLEHQADLLAARPIIESVASEIVGGRAFTNLFRAAVRDVHRAVFNRDEDTVTLTVGDVGTVLAAAVRKFRPSLAKELEDTVRVLALLLLTLFVLLAAGALALSLDRRRTAVELGIGIASAGVLLIVLYAVLRSVAIDHAEGAENR